MFGVGRLGLLGVASPLLTPAWVFNNATVDLDFVNNRYFGPGQVACSRASVGYASDAGGTWVSFASNVARVTNKGLLIEEGRTNGIRNNAMQGAAVGRPGTVPTNWIYQATNGLSTQVVALGAELGVDYIDLRIFGTPSTTGDVRLAFDGNTQIAASVGQTWAQSEFIKIAAGSLANIGQAHFLEQYRDNVGTSLTTGTINFTPSSTFTRFAGTGLALHAATAFVVPEFAFGVTNGQPVDVTFRIGWPQ